MKQIFVLLIFLSNYTVIGQVETLSYDLTVAESSIGTLTAVKTKKGNSTIYTANSEVIVHIFGETQISTSLTVEFLNGILQSSHYKIEKNGALNDESATTLKNGIYYVNHGGKTSEVNSRITYSTVMLYFDEPKGINNVFAELEGINKTIGSAESSIYILSDPGNHHTNTYTYSNGILKEGVISHELFNFKLTLKE